MYNDGSGVIEMDVLQTIREKYNSFTETERRFNSFR